MCEDYPCCGHERGDCEGGLYGSDESIKEDEMARLMREDRDSMWNRQSADDY